jgi:DNA-binding transcriptional ArsR family regulator
MPRQGRSSPSALIARAGELVPAEPRRRRGGDVVDARVVKALAHPTRVRILRILRDRELASPVELAAELGIPLGTVGYHVRRLELLGFIELAKRTQRRGAVEHHYRARSALDLPSEPGRPPPRAGSGKRTAAALAAVEDAHAALECGGFDGVVALAEWRSVTLDARGRARLEAEARGWQAAVERIVRASARRLAAAGTDAVPHACTVVALLCDAPEDDLVS